MENMLIEAFLGWLFRPIMLWNIQDIITVLLEIALIWLWIDNVKNLIKIISIAIKENKKKCKRRKKYGL